MRIQQPKRENKPHHRPTTASRGPAHTCGTSLGDDIRAVSGSPAASRPAGSPVALRAPSDPAEVLFFTLNREDFSFVIHLDRQPRTSRRREAQTGSRARSGSRSERTLDAVEHSRTLMEWWPFLIFHRGGLRIKVINNTRSLSHSTYSCMFIQRSNDRDLLQIRGSCGIDYRVGL